MQALRFCGKIIMSGLSGVGATTLSSDLSSFMRSAADWIDAGGSVGIVLWAVAIIFGLWAIFDVVKWLLERREARKSATQRTGNPEPDALISRWEYDWNILAHILGLEPRRTKREWDEFVNKSRNNPKRK